MGVASYIWPFHWRGSFSLYLLLFSLIIGLVNATEDLIAQCATVDLDKPIYQDSIPVDSSSNCLIFQFESVNSANSNGNNVYLTIYNISASPSPMFGIDDDEDLDYLSKSLSNYCGCNLCAAALDSEAAIRNASASIQDRISRSINCLPALSAQGRHFRIPVGGRLLIVAKQSNLYAYKLAYRYIYDLMCPTVPSIIIGTGDAKPAQWCLGSVQLNDGNTDNGHQICISSKWICDGFDDCLDRSDENNCCPPQFTRCPAGSALPGKCVPRCNGISECQSGFNEIDCRLPDCPDPNLSCRVPSDDVYGDQSMGSFQCLAANRRCNGIADCAEALDELGCDASNCGPENGTYLCESDIQGRCIPQAFVCDGQPNCPNGEDEAFCPLLSRRLNIVLCLSGLFSCASVLFVIAYFHRRYCMAYRRNRGRHRRRRFDLMSPVEQAARYFMQMCGAPPSYNQVMQMGGDGDAAAPGMPPMDEPSAISSTANTVATVDVIVQPPPPPPPLQSIPTDRDVSISCDDESSETEYLSTLTFPHNNIIDNNGNTNNFVQIHSPAVFVLQRPQDEPAEYAECSDDPCPPSTFAPASSDAAECSSHIEMTITCSSEVDLSNNDESQVLHRRPNSEGDHQ